MAVWELPPGEYEEFLPYQLIDDEFQFSEFASFQTMSLSVDEVLVFYRGYFADMGIETNEFAAGESTVMNLTDPTNPAWSGVMQTGIGSDGYVTITQNFSEFKESTDTTTTQPDAVASGDGSNSISE